MVSDYRGTKFINSDKFNYDLIDVPNLFSNPFLFPINIFKYFLNVFQSISFLKKKKTDIIISTGDIWHFRFV